MLISVNTFWTILLIVHGLLAIALLGALTHQAMAVTVLDEVTITAADAVIGTRNAGPRNANPRNARRRQRSRTSGIAGAPGG